MPSMTSPSPGMNSPASTTTVSPRRNCDAGTCSSRLPTTRRAVVSLRILRNVAACAWPRPSATASAKLAKITVNHSQALTQKVNHAGAASALGATRSRNQTSVVSTLPTSTTNMTGFRATCCGTSLRRLAIAAGPRICGSNRERSLALLAMSRLCEAALRRRLVWARCSQWARRRRSGALHVSRHGSVQARSAR
jgi:hypothetical protein